MRTRPPTPNCTQRARAMTAIPRRMFAAIRIERRSTRSTHTPIGRATSRRTRAYSVESPAIQRGSSVSEAASRGIETNAKPSARFDAAFAPHRTRKERPRDTLPRLPIAPPPAAHGSELLAGRNHSHSGGTRPAPVNHSVARQPTYESDRFSSQRTFREIARRTT